MMKVLITGSEGFIAKNLIAELKTEENIEILAVNKNTSKSVFKSHSKEADFIFHLAGVNRPEEVSEFMEGNYNFTSELLDNLKFNKNKSPIMISSSIQAEYDNPYGISKKEGEELLRNYSEETGAEIFIYRFPNVFGKWCKPNYNSVIATFCYNISRNIPINIIDESAKMRLIYIDDVVTECKKLLQTKTRKKEKVYKVPIEHESTVGEIANLIYSFKESRQNRSIPDMSNPLIKKLYSTYLSYLPEKEFSYNLKMNVDQRGSFTEFIKTPDRGQVSVNISKPGITKGDHWHHTKNEKFLVVSGKGIIRFRDINSHEVIEYYVEGSEMKVVDIPVGYTHNIENIGKEDMVTIMWANEAFDPNNPDTNYLEV